MVTHMEEVMQHPEPLHGPAHPLPQLTSGELKTYRKQLERAVTVLKETPVAPELQSKLDAVKAEEESRARISETQTPLADPGHPDHHSA
jgi:hypothetical protein